MKILPSLTLAGSIAAAGVCGLMSLSSTDAQEPSSSTTASQATSKENAESAKESPGPDTGKRTLRRNEASGAVALVTLEEARDKLIGYASLQANIIETVAIGGRNFRMRGQYIQGKDLKLRLEYTVDIGGTIGKLVEVCDGQILWAHHQIGKEQRVTRRNVRQILEAASQNERTPENLLLAELGLGGLPGLLASIQRAVQFEKQWELDLESAPFLVLDGGWKPEQRAKFLGPNAEPNQPLPVFVPDRVRIYFQKDTLFPRRIMYLKRSEESKSLRPMVTIDFVDITVNSEVDESAFVFTPPENVERQDVTEGYVKQLVQPDGQPAKANPKSQESK